MEIFNITLTVVMVGAFFLILWVIYKASQLQKERSKLLRAMTVHGMDVPCAMCGKAVCTVEGHHIKLEIVRDGLVELKLPRTLDPGESMDFTYAHKDCWSNHLVEVDG